MKERPMVFSAPMIRALLDGSKTQARYVVKPMRGRQSAWLSRELIDKSPRLTLTQGDGRVGAQMEHPRGGPLGWVACPHGAPGDRLWVRETWVHSSDGVLYRERGDRWPYAWRPSVHMPRWASRISREITDVRVERLQDISEADARAEGIALDDCITPRAEFAELWNSINGKRAPWASNPWVWVIEFKRVEHRGER